MTKLLTLILLLCSCTALAQTFQSGYYHFYEDYAERVFENNDGTFTVIGTGHSISGSYYGPFRLKIGPLGNMIEKDLYEMSGTIWNQSRHVHEAIRDADSNLVVITAAGTLLKLDKDGVPIWAIDPFNFGDVELTDIDITPNGLLAVVGITIFRDLQLFLIDGNGTVVNEHNYDGPLGWEYPCRVTANDDGGFYLSAYNFSNGYTTTLMRADSNGALLWAAKPDSINSVVDMLPGPNNGVYIAGVTWNGQTPHSILTLLDSSGNVVWSHGYFGSGGFQAGAFTRTSDQGFILAGWAGNFSPQNHLVKTDSLGNVEWNRYNSTGAPLWISSIIQDQSGGYVYTGSAKISANSDYDAQVIRLDADGMGYCNNSGAALTDSTNYPLQLTPYLISDSVVTFSGMTPLLVASIFSPLQDTIRCQTPVSVEDPESLEIRCWPNPSHDFLKIQVPGLTSSASLRVVDVQGRTVYQGHLPDSLEFALDVQSWPAGIYLLQIEHSGMGQSLKFVVQH